MSIQDVTAGHTAAEQLTQRPEVQITRPLAPDERDKLWTRYAALIKKTRRSTKDDDELFQIRQRLVISDAENEVNQHVIATGEKLKTADDELDAAVKETDKAHAARQQLQLAQHEQWLKMQKEMEAAKLRCQIAECRNSTAMVHAQEHNGLRARFYRLFGGVRPGSAECPLPSNITNELVARGLDPRDLSACR